MKLSTRSRYGTRMLLDIALNSIHGMVRICDISKRQGISMKYLEKLIRPLKDGGLIKSKRGPRGGHSLTRDPAEITVGEVVRLLEGKLILTECAANPSICDIASDCLTRRVWLEASNAIYEKLDSITFADLLKEAGRAGMLVDHCVPSNVNPRNGKRE